MREFGQNKAVAQAKREAQAKAECKRLILAVVSERAQANIANAAAVGMLPAAQLAAARDLVSWVAAMRDACAALIASDAPIDGSEWPEPSKEIRALAARF